MTEFAPPCPARPSATLSPLRVLRGAYRNLLEVWEEKAFEWQFFSTRLLSHRIYVCNSPDTVRHVLVTNNANFERKSPQMRHALAPLLGDGLFVSDGDVWRSRRPAAQAAIHASRLPLFAPVMVEAAAAEMADRWDGIPPDRVTDILSEMGFLTSEIISRTIFGKALGAAHAREIVEGFDDYQRGIGQMDFMSLLGLPEWLPRLRGFAVGRAARRIRAAMDETIGASRAAETEGGPSLLHLLAAAARETGRELDADALRNEAATLFMAGHETTANSLTWTWFLLSQAPEVEARLHRELDDVLAGRRPGLADFAKLPYTRAVLEEAMRLYPPVPILSRQALRDDEIRRRPVKAGSLVLVVPWLLHRHKRLWDKPDHFIPERFLPENGPAHEKYAYIPFATGPRICAGAAFALTEAVLCLAILAQRFRLRLKPGTVVEPVARLTLRPRDGLPMTIERRGAVAETSGSDLAGATGRTTPQAP